MEKIKGFGKLKVYNDLARVKLSIGVTLSSVTGYFISDTRIEFSFVFMIIGVFLLATGASVLNQVMERDRDNKMVRTQNRPIPLQLIKPTSALWLSVLHISTGIVFLMFTGIVPVVLGILNIILYNFAYTLLKRITFLAIIPGAAVGAIPPLMGYTATGALSPDQDIVLFSVFMFLWQLPHFWLIVVKHRVDYESAGFKTFSKNVTERQIKNLIFVWVLFSTAFLMAFIFKGVVFNKYLAAVLVPLNLLFIYLFYRILYQWQRSGSARGAFIIVNSFGLLMMLLFIINAFL